MPAETIRHLHLVHPAETSLWSKREKHNLIRLRIVSVGFVVWGNTHGPNSQRYKIPACLSNFQQNPSQQIPDTQTNDHQVLMKEEDKQFTAFEFWKLYEFNCLPFGLTNTLSAFQGILEKFVDRKKLQRTYLYSDDELFSEQFKEEHDKIVKVFLLAA